MSQEQFSSLSDDVRIPAELLTQRLEFSLSLKPKGRAISDDGGIAFFFEAEKEGLKMTADIEIYADGSVSASVIPYIHTPEGWDIYQSEEEPIELWDVEEEPPFEETIALIHQRFGITLLDRA